MPDGFAQGFSFARLARRVPQLPTSTKAAWLAEGSTVWQTAAGGVASGENEPVGLILDRYETFGAEQLAGDNSTFEAGFGDWAFYTGAAASIVGGRWSASALSIYRNNAVDMPIGAWVEATYDWTRTSAGIVGGVGDRSFAQVRTPADASLSGSARGIFRATIAQAGLRLVSGSGTLTLDNVQMRRLTRLPLAAPADEARPTRFIGSIPHHDYDGGDDRVLTEAFAAGTLPSDATVAANIRSLDGEVILLADSGATLRYLGCWDVGSSSTALTHNAGAPAIRIDGAPFTGTTRNDLSVALSDGDWHTIVFAGANLASWTSFGISNYPDANFRFAGGINAVAIAAGSDATTVAEIEAAMMVRITP